MDTRKLAVETYGCSCEGGVEYGLIIKDTDPAIMEGDDEVMSIVTHRRHMPEPETDEDAWNPYGQQDFTNELVKRWNAYPELVERLKDAEWLLQGTVNAGRNTIADDEVLANIRAAIAKLNQ